MPYMAGVLPAPLTRSGNYALYYHEQTYERRAD